MKAKPDSNFLRMENLDTIWWEKWRTIPKSEEMTPLLIWHNQKINMVETKTKSTCEEERYFTLLCAKDTLWQFKSSTCFGAYEKLFVFNGKWLLEYHGNLIIDGTSENIRMGYDACFSVGIFDSSIVYFYKKNGKYGIFLSGNAFANTYDSIPYFTCCEPALFSPQIYLNEFIFFGSRNGTWYRVEGFGKNTPISFELQCNKSKQ